MWRTTPDIMPKWLSIQTIYEHNVRLYEHAGPGAWNDPDMLEVGNGKLTENENRAHFSLWCMMAAPLILGNDVRKFVDGNNEQVRENPTLKIVTNKNLINIDQDRCASPASAFAARPGWIFWPARCKTAMWPCACLTRAPPAARSPTTLTLWRTMRT